MKEKQSLLERIMVLNGTIEGFLKWTEGKENVGLEDYEKHLKEKMGI